MIDGSMLTTADVVNSAVIFHIQHILFLHFDCDYIYQWHFQKLGQPNPAQK